jgi:SAM-dependent methyltransferase
VFEGLGKRLRAYAEKDGRGYPDWATRYVPVVNGLRHRQLDTERILEVGANENGFARFAGARTVVVDLAFDHVRAARQTQPVLPVVAGASALPFRDDTFDVCVSMDTFEHLPDGMREGAAGEMVRVLRDSGTAVVGFPSGEASARAEEAINAAYEGLTGRPLGWLAEHAEHGLPDASRMAGLLQELARDTHRVTLSRNGSLWVWRAMWRILMCGWPGRGNAVFQALLRLVTPVLCRMHFGVCYRAVIRIEPSGAAMKNAKRPD